MKKKQKWNGCTPFKKGHKLRVGLKHSDEFKEKRKGSGNPNWSGDNVTFSGIHLWVRKNFGKPNFCEHCKLSDKKRYDWSNKDHKYSRNREDWQRLCRGCHMRYDYANFRNKK